MKSMVSQEDRRTAIEMWNSGVPSQQIEAFLGISYSIHPKITYWRKTLGVNIASRSERREAVKAWKTANADARESEKDLVDPWEVVYAQLRSSSGESMVPAIGQSRVEIVISVLVDGEEVSRRTTTVLQPEAKGIRK